MSRSLTDEENETIREILSILFKVNGLTQGELAKMLRGKSPQEAWTQSTLSSIVTRNQGAQWHLARGLYRVIPRVIAQYRSVSEEQASRLRALRERMELLFSLDPEALRRTRKDAAPPLRYERMLAALEMGRDAGIPEECLAAFVAADHGASRGNLSAEDWWARLKIFASEWDGHREPTHRRRRAAG